MFFTILQLFHIHITAGAISSPSLAYDTFNVIYSPNPEEKKKTKLYMLGDPRLQRILKEVSIPRAFRGSWKRSALEKHSLKLTQQLVGASLSKRNWFMQGAILGSSMRLQTLQHIDSPCAGLLEYSTSISLEPSTVGGVTPSEQIVTVKNGLNRAHLLTQIVLGKFAEEGLDFLVSTGVFNFGTDTLNTSLGDGNQVNILFLTHFLVKFILSDTCRPPSIPSER